MVQSQNLVVYTWVDQEELIFGPRIQPTNIVKNSLLK